MVALDRRGQGQPGAGVAAGWLDDGPARLELAGLLTRLHQREANAVFDTAAWIEELDLCQHCRRNVLGYPVQANQRCASDSFENVLVVAHVSSRRRIPPCDFRRTTAFQEFPLGTAMNITVRGARHRRAIIVHSISKARRAPALGNWACLARVEKK